MGWSWTSARWRAECPSAAHCNYPRQFGGGICRIVRVLHCPSDACQCPGMSVCDAARGSQPDVLDTPLTTAYAPPETQPVLCPGAAHGYCVGLITPAKLAGPIAVRSTQFGGVGRLHIRR